MSDDHCPQCGSPLPLDSPQELCPKCLLAVGMETVAVPSAGPPLVPRIGKAFGEYEITALLGSGGMGAVYEAEDRKTGRRVALKVLSDRLESPEHRHRFLREGRLAASYNHPNSVYIFGTEEIEGTPVITMELVQGGTLQDRVKAAGPLPIDEAVDAVLQIIAGLEAAENAGVLHRDIKPSNCFVDSDGSVKIGDFGLSISTAPRIDSFQTETGAILGTPAFASPEQLRGDEVDVRSDIYSVGITLYYLLTGRTPFQASQMMRLLATVLEQPAPSPREFRPEIPHGLAKVILRCLAKRPEQRFSDYPALRKALLPYTSQAPLPGTLGYRLLAGVIDFLLLTTFAALLPLLWIRDVRSWQVYFDAISDGGPQMTPTLTWLALVGIAGHIAYFAITEGVWGRTAGKQLCGIQVIRPNGEPPGIWRALVRASIVYLSNGILYWIPYVFDSQASTSPQDDWRLLVGSVLFSASLFVTVRRRNGFAAVHDLVSGTRVVRQRNVERRPSLDASDEPLPESAHEESIGPYHVLGRVDESRPDLLLGYDGRLLRRVWIRVGSSSDAPGGRVVSRSGRLRWLGGDRDGPSPWDAYEAPTGKPFLEVIQTPRTWSEVRFWLHDLAEELQASKATDATPPTFALDRIWITADGRAKLLDFAAPQPPTAVESQPSRNQALRESAPQLLLKQVALSALDGRPVGPAEAASRTVGHALPRTVTETLERLGRESEGDLPIDELKRFTERAATVSVPKRVAILAICWCVPLMMAAYASLMLRSEREFLAKHPEVGQLVGYLSFYHLVEEFPTSGQPADPLRAAVELVLAADYRRTIEDRSIWDDPLSEQIVNADDQQLLQSIVKRRSQPDPDELAKARQELNSVQTYIRNLAWSPADYGILMSGPVDFLLMASILMALLVVLPSLMSVTLFGNTLLLRSLEIDLVTNRGEPASRPRRLLRHATFWGIALLAISLLIVTANFGRPRILTLIVLYWSMKMFLVERSLPDIITGTRLMPRYEDKQLFATRGVDDASSIDDRIATAT